MPRPICRSGFAVLLLLVAGAGCQRAERYGPVSSTSAAPPPDIAPPGPSAKTPARYAWLPPQPRRDIPIRFVASTSAEWAKLPSYWSITPHPVAGQQTAHI